jgi:hypothetical protein
MNAKTLASQLKVQIQEIKNKGSDSVSCDALINYLISIENGPDGEISTYDLEMMKSALRNKNEADNRAHQSKLEGFRTVIQMGQNAIKTGFILHGGAVIALIALAGHLFQQERTMKYVPQLAGCIMPFAIGVFLVALVSGLAYVCQTFFEEADQFSQEIARRLNNACLVIGLICLAVFVWGATKTYLTLGSIS